jgi:glycosyltransferase involved in cell wall biosynthesis
LDSRKPNARGDDSGGYRLLAIIEARSITGPAKNLLEFARMARSSGIETVVATFVRGEESNLFLDTVARERIPIHPIPERGRFDRSVMQSLAALVERVNPDVIQTHAVKSHFLVRAAGLPRRIPWVAFHHGYTWPNMQMRLYNQLDQWSLRAAAKVLTVSLAFRRQLQERGVPAERIEVIHNAIQPDWALEARRPERAAQLRASMNIAPDRKIILIVGRLSKEKDYLGLLDAFSRLPPSLSPHLVIVGDGPERNRIERRIKTLGLSESVTLTGQRESAEPYYGIANLAVLASRSEGSPNALLEAMAAELPVVATAVGGIPEIVTDRESALLVKPDDANGLAEAMRRLLEDPSLASTLTARARQLVQEQFTPEERTRRLVEIYRGIAAGKAG